jgi:cysteinyl-tRNA synthetase
VRPFSCGPTVYDFAHIGNFRAFLTYDLIKRWLLFCGYEVDHVCNLTDVDDKIIDKMKKENKTLSEITDRYTQAFFEDIEVSIFLQYDSYSHYLLL